MLVQEIMLWFQLLCMLSAFAVAVLSFREKSLPVCLRQFYWYPGVAVSLAIISIIHKSIFPDRFHYGLIVNKLSLIFHFVFFSRFIYMAISDEKLKRQMLLLSVVLLLGSCAVILKTLFQHEAFYAFSIVNLALLVFCLMYFIDLFDNKVSLDMFADSSFWVVCGIFLCFSITVPLYAIKKFLLSQAHAELSVFANSIASFTYGLMHLFFFKAYLCSMQLKKAS